MIHRNLDVHPLTSTGMLAILIGTIDRAAAFFVAGAVFFTIGFVADLLVLREIRRHHRDEREHREYERYVFTELMHLRAQLARIHAAKPKAAAVEPEPAESPPWRDEIMKAHS